MWGHPSLPHPRAHERWAGSTHRTAMHSAGGVSRGRGGRCEGCHLNRGRHCMRLPWHLRQHVPETEPLAGARGASGRDSQREAASPDSVAQRQRGHWPRQPAGSCPHHPPRQAALEAACRSTHTSTDPESRPRSAPVASQSDVHKDSPPEDRPGDPSRTRLVSPYQGLSATFLGGGLQLGCPRTADPSQPPWGWVWPKSHCL